MSTALRHAGARSLASVAAVVSQRLGLGAGSVIGGRLALAVDPGALARLASGRRVALVSGTNGKTTTTALLSAALRTREQVVSNPEGSNLPAGLVAALSSSGAGVSAVLEVDEAWMDQVCRSAQPELVVLLNLSRDQLDRVSEVGRLAARWRRLAEELGQGTKTTLIANADDPLVAWAAMGCSRVEWVGAGSSWRMDSAACPGCGQLLETAAAGWSCTGCGLRRPDAPAWLDRGDLVLRCRDGGALETRLPLALSLPGRFNQANAALAVVAARTLGVGAEQAIEAMAGLNEVAGRYQVLDLPGSAKEAGVPLRARLLLAKNPAGWVELLALLDEQSPVPAPVLLAINSRIADGRDPSWLWDVPFESLAGRATVATGGRCWDLAVRLRYAGVDHIVEPDPAKALALAPRLVGAGRAIDVAANYTAFQDLRRVLAGRR